MSDVRKLAKIVADHSRQIKGLSGGPQAAYSSIEGGSMDSYDSDGKLRLRIGAQDDGTQGVKYVQGPPPPRPTPPVVSVDGPVVRVRWDGMLLGGHIPEDFARIDVHFALASEDLEDEAAVRGNLATSAGNETVLAATQTGTYRVGLVAMSQSRARSEMSDVTEVEVELVNLKGAIDTAVDNASGGSNHYSPTPPAGTDHDPDRDLWFDTAEDDDGLVSYSPHRWDADLQEWVSLEDQRTQAIQDAQREFESVVTDGLNDAQQAAGNAQQAADNAMTEAETARAEATSKAAAAQQAAEAHADAVAEAERLAAIAAASDDATAKAAAAQAAAEVTAAADASAKAQAAQQAAEAKAQTAQDTADDAMARADDAHTRAGNAETAAGAAMRAATHNAKNLWSTSNPSGTAPQGTIWFKIDQATRNVVGQWQQTAGSDTSFGSNWEKRQLTDALFDNIDAGKINTGYLDVAALIRAGAIQADKLLIGSDQNLLVDPEFKTYGTGWGSVTGGDIVEGEGLEGSTLLRIPQSSAHAGSYLGLSESRAQYRMKVTGGTRYRVSAYVRASSLGDPTSIVAQLYLRFYTPTDKSEGSFSWGSPSNFSFRVRDLVEGEWALVSFEPIAPEGAVEASVGLYKHGNHTTSPVEWCLPSVRSMVGSTLIEDGAINTPHLAAASITGESGILANLDAGVITYGFMSGARLEAGSVDTPQLAFGAATGDVLSVDALNFKTAVGLDIRGSSFRAGDAVEMTEDFGIRQFGPDGALNVSLPSDGSPAEFRGDLSARTLTATGRMSIQGPGAIASGGVLELESGVVPPVAGPQITNTWDRLTLPSIREDQRAAGIAWMDGHWWRALTTTVPYLDGGRAMMQKITTTGELVSEFVIAFRTTIDGVTVLGGKLYVLGAAFLDGVGSTQRRSVVVYNPDGTEHTRWEDTLYTSGTYQQGIGTDGTNIILAKAWNDGILRMRKWTPTGTYLETAETGFRLLSDVAGVYFGSADFGAAKVVVARRSAETGWMHFITLDNNPYTYRPELSWQAADLSAPVDFVWDGAQFHSLTPTGDLVSYQSHETNRIIGDDEDDWWGAVTWATGSQETTAGPSTRFRYLHRAQLRVQNGDVPEGVEAARFYTSKGASEPGRTDLYWRVTSEQPHEPLRVTSISSSSGGTNPPASNTFATDAPGEIRSAIGGFRVDGAGSGEWGSFNFHSDGSVTGKGTSITGIVNHPGINSGGNEHYVTVTFPVGRFTEPPVIVLTNSNGHLTPTVNRNALTATSFQVRTWNFSTGNAGENITTWIAVED